MQIGHLQQENGRGVVSLPIFKKNGWEILSHPSPNTPLKSTASAAVRS